MSLFDHVLNRASDAARRTADQLETSQRRRQLQDQIAAQETIIGSAMREVGRVAVEAHASGRPVPASVANAVPAIQGWRSEIDTHRLEIVDIERRLADLYSNPPGGPPQPPAPPPAWGPSPPQTAPPPPPAWGQQGVTTPPPPWGQPPAQHPPPGAAS